MWGTTLKKSLGELRRNDFPATAVLGALKFWQWGGGGSWPKPLLSNMK